MSCVGTQNKGGASMTSQDVFLNERDDFVKYHFCGWHGWVRKQWKTHFEERDPFDVLGIADANVYYHGASDTYRVVHDGTVLFCKYYRPPSRFTRFIRWVLKPSVAIREWRTCCALGEAGIASIPVILVVHRRCGITPENMLVSQDIGGLTFQEHFNQLDGTSERRDLIESAGQQVAFLHKAGFCHGGLFEDHIRIRPDEGDRFIYIDHTSSRHQMIPSLRRRLHNLAQFLRSNRNVPPSYHIRFLDAYLDACGFSRARKERWKRKAWRLAVERLRGKGKLPPGDGGIS